jgi:hypothetical protein
LLIPEKINKLSREIVQQIKFGRDVLMKPTDRDARVTEIDEGFLFCDVSDEALERACPVDDVGFEMVTLVFGTFISGNCACPVSAS